MKTLFYVFISIAVTAIILHWSMFRPCWRYARTGCHLTKWQRFKVQGYVYAPITFWIALAAAATTCMVSIAIKLYRL